MKLIKKQNENLEENTLTLEYVKWNDDLAEIEKFIEGKRAGIVGYGANKEMYNIKVDRVLYFEAVGELVFAYTKSEVYEIKMRLYQIEEMVANSQIFRASKSVLINIRKVQSLRPALNGRLFAKMINGEDLLVSRGYAKTITNYIKSL